MNNHISETLHQLDDLAIGTTCKLVAFQDAGLAGKLLAMGVLPGSDLHVVQKLWFGSSLFIEINNQRIALRREEAATILVKKVQRYV